MPRRPHHHRALLVLLALWLGTWPAADAVTGVSWVVIVEPASGVAGARCPLPSRLVEQVEASAVCCRMDAAPGCADTGCGQADRNGCARCHAVGGLVLFAAAPWAPEADLAVRGTVTPAGAASPSRFLQPPVPPPWSLS